MKLKKSLLLFITLLLVSNLKSQSLDFPKHTFVFDIGGTGGYGSFNYERNILEKNNYFLSGKIGFSFIRLKDYETEFNPDLLFPITIQVGRRFKNHHAIIGVGQTVASIVQASSDFSKKIRNHSLSGNLVAGYRFQKRGKPLSIQVSYTPLFLQYKRFRHWGGLSIGYSFLKGRKNDLHKYNL